MTVGKAVLDPETLKNQATLTAEQEDALQKEGNSIWNPPAKEDEGDNSGTDDSGKKEGQEDDAAAKEAEAKEKKEKEPTAEEKAKAEETRLKAEDELAAKAREKKETERSEDEKQAVLAAEKREKEAYDSEIKAFAEAEKLTPEEAEKELTHIKKVQAHYDGDQKKLSKAVLHSQREYAKLQSHAKQIQEQLQLIQEGKIRVPDGKGSFKVITKQEFETELVKGYREQFPTKTEEMEDKAVYEEAIAHLRSVGVEKNQMAAEKLKIDADQKRRDLLAQIPENDREFSAEIKEVLNFVPDGSVMDENYSLEDSLWWAKGKVYDQNVKEAERKGYERGKKEALENKRILGEVNPPAGGKPPAEKKSPKSELTEDEQERALAMYQSTTMTDEEKFSEFMELKKSGSFI